MRKRITIILAVVLSLAAVGLIGSKFAARLDDSSAIESAKAELIATEAFEERQAIRAEGRREDIRRISGY